MCQVVFTVLLVQLSLTAGARAQNGIPGQQELSTMSGDGTATFGTTVVDPAGLRGQIYKIRSNTWSLPDLDKLEPVGTIWTSTLDIAPRHFKEGFPGVTKRFEWFAIDYSGRFWIEHPGLYSFALMSDDGSKLFIDDHLVIDNDCQHPPVVRSSQAPMSGGIHTLRVLYFQGPRDCLALMLAVAGPGENWRVFSTEEFKPPHDTDDWKYSDSKVLNTNTDPDANRTKLGEGKYPRKPEELVMRRRTTVSTKGCLVPFPVIHCAAPSLTTNRARESKTGEPMMYPNGNGTLQPNSVPH